MGWVWMVAAGWMLLAIGVALLIVRGVSMADRRTAEDEARFAEELDLVDEPNIVMDLPPLGVAPEPAVPERPAPVEPAAAPLSEIAAKPREAPTIPGLPSARPPVGRPPVPRAERERQQRQSGTG